MEKVYVRDDHTAGLGRDIENAYITASGASGLLMASRKDREKVYFRYKDDATTRSNSDILRSDPILVELVKSDPDGLGIKYEIVIYFL